MKQKNFLFLVTVMICGFIASIATACSGDDDNDDIVNDSNINEGTANGDGNLVSKIITNQENGEYIYTYQFDYDSMGRVKEVKLSGNGELRTLYYEYNNENKLIYTCPWGKSTKTSVYHLNQFGYIEDGCTYYDNGSLKTSTCNRQTYDYTSAFKISGPDGGVLYSMSDIKNDTNLDLNYLFFPNYFDVECAGLLGLCGNKFLNLISTVERYSRITKITDVKRDSRGKIIEIDSKSGDYHSVNIGKGIDFKVYIYY